MKKTEWNERKRKKNDQGHVKSLKNYRWNKKERFYWNKMNQQLNQKEF